MVIQHFREIHLVELIAGKDQYIITLEWLDMPESLSYRIGGALVPGRVIGSLFCGEDIHECFTECRKMISVLDMTVKRGRIELGQYKHSPDPIIQTIGNRNVDQ